MSDKYQGARQYRGYSPLAIGYAVAMWTSLLNFMVGGATGGRYNPFYIQIILCLLAIAYLVAEERRYRRAFYRRYEEQNYPPPPVLRETDV